IVMVSSGDCYTKTSIMNSMWLHVGFSYFQRIRLRTIVSIGSLFDEFSGLMIFLDFKLEGNLLIIKETFYHAIELGPDEIPTRSIGASRVYVHPIPLVLITQ